MGVKERYLKKQKEQGINLVPSSNGVKERYEQKQRGKIQKNSIGDVATKVSQSKVGKRVVSGSLQTNADKQADQEAYAKYAVNKESNIDGLKENQTLPKAEFKPAPKKSFWDKVADGWKDFWEGTLPEGSNAAKQFEKSKDYSSNKGSWTEDQLAQIAIDSLHNSDSVDGRTYAMVDEAYERLSISDKYKDSDLVSALREAKKSWAVSPGSAALINTAAAVGGMGADIASFANSLGANKIPFVKDFLNSAVEGGRALREEAARYNKGGYGETIGNFNQGVVNLVPYFIMGPGKGVADVALKSPKYVKYLAPIVKNPSFWYSLTSMWGNKYQEAIDGGASEQDALKNAMYYAIPAALVEVSGGIGAPGEQPLSRTIIEEIGEELAQDVISGLSDKSTTKLDLPIWSTTEDAVVNPINLGKTALMTAPIVAVAGGANKVANNILSTKTRKQNIKTMNVKTDAVNQILAGDNALEPLPKNATEQEIQQRAEEIQKRIENPLEYIQRDSVTDVLGANGKKAFAVNYKEGQNESDYAQGFRRMYNLGQSNIPIEKATAEIDGNKFIQSLSKDQRMAAYYSGQNDAKAQLEAEKNNVQFANFYSDDAGVVENDAVHKVDAEELKAIDKLARAVGSQVVFEEDIEGFNGYAELGKIHISLNAENKLAVVAAHEVTHRMQELAPESYRKYRDFVMNAVGVDAVENYQKALNAKDIYLTDSEIMDEIAADYTKKILSNPESMQKFIDDALNGRLDTNSSVAENRTILEKLLDSIKEFIRKITTKFPGRKAEQNQAARDAYGVGLDTLKQAKNLLQKALKDSADVVADKSDSVHNFEKDARYENNVKRKNSVKMDSKGNSYWQIETDKDIFKGISAVKELQNAAYDYILNGDKGDKVVGLIDGKNLEFIRVSAKEYVYGDASTNLTTEEYKQKMRMSTSIIDLIDNAYISYDAPDHKNHKLFPGGFKNYQGRVGIDNTIFKYIVRVGKAKNGMIFYDINLEVDGKVPRANSTSLIKSSTSTTKLPQNDKVVNTHSMQKTKNNSQRKNSVKMEDVLRQNETLKKAYAKLTRDFVRLKNKETRYRHERIAKVVKSILKEFDFAYDHNTLTSRMEGLAEDTKQMIAGYMDMDTFQRKVNDIAKDIIEAGAKTDSAIYTESKDLRDYLRTTRITLDEGSIRNLGEEYETIRKGTFGRLRLVKEGGTPIDAVYHELSELYPEYFNMETERNGSEQLRQIQSVLDDLQSLKSDVFGGYTEEGVEWLSGIIMDRIYNDIFVSGEAGDATVSVDIKAMREEMADNLQNIMARERRWREREYTKLQEKYEKKTKSYTETRQKAIKVKQIKLHTERLSKALINPSERFAVPEDLKKPVAELLECIDLTNDRIGENTRETLGDLAKTYHAIAEQEYELGMVLDPQLVYNIEDISDAVKKLDVKDKRVSDLDLVTLEKLRTSIMAMETMLRNYNQTFREGNRQRIDDLASKAAAEIQERIKGVKKNSKLKVVKGFSDMLNFDMLNPWDYFHQMGDTFDELFAGLREGENKQIKNLAKSKDYLEQITKKYGISKEDMADKSIKTYTLANGKTVELTKAQVMSFYLLWRQNQTHEHITEGGIRPAKVSQNLIENKDGTSKVKMTVSEDYSAVRVTLDDVAAILETLTPDEKSFADSISDFFTKECAQWGNEVALRLYGYKKFNTPNYFPIVSDKMYLQEDFGVSADATIKNMGITKRRIKHANNPIIIEDIFDVYARHVSDMAKYNAYVLPLQDVQRVFNHISFGKDFAEVEVEQIKNAVNNYTAEEASRISRDAKTYRNFVEGHDMSLKEFAERSLKGTDKFEKLYMGKIPDDMVERINNVLRQNGVDVDVSGEHFIVTNDMFRHVEKDHGINSKDSAEKITPDNIDYLKDVISSPDGIEFNGYTDEGNPVINFVKRINETKLVYVQFNSETRQGLIGKTLYFNSKMGTKKEAISANNVENNPVQNAKSDRDQTSTNNISSKGDFVNTLKEGESIKALIASKYGKQAVDYFSKLMVDINMGINNQYGNALSSNLIANYKKAKMGLNARVVIQQPMSYIRAAALIDPEYMTKAMGKKVNIETVFKYSPIAQWKSWGFFSTDTGKDMYSLLTGEKDIADYTMYFAGKADEMTWKRIWAAVELETADKYPDLQKGSQAFYEICGKRFDEIIDRTQVVDSTLHRSQALRSPDGFTKMAYSFMSEPLKTYNLLRTSIVDQLAKPSAESKKTVARTFVVCAVSSVLLACVTGAFDTLTGDEEDEFVKNLSENLLGDTLGMIPYVKDIYSVLRGFTVERMDMQGISDAVNAVMMFSKDNYTWRYKMANLFAKGAELFGIPVGSFKKAVYDLAIKNVFEGTENYLVPYTMAKQMYKVDGGKKGEFLDILFNAYKAGNKKHYNKIFKDLMESGLDAASIESGLRARFKKSGIKETFDVPWNKNVSSTASAEKEEKFGVKSLTSSQYQKYQQTVVGMEEDIVADLKRMRGGLSDEAYQKRVDAAYDYAEETALEKVAREKYESDVSWINKAQIAEEQYGLDPAEFIMFHKYYNELKPPAGQDKFKTGEKKALIVDYLNGMDLTDAEWRYLYYEVAGYKK